MNDLITHRAFLGEGEHDFCLTDAMITELEHQTGLGIGALQMQMMQLQFKADHLALIIRLGLIGAAMNPENAHRLVEAYVRNRPLGEVFPLALDILDARWNGKAETPDDIARNAEDDYARFVAEVAA
ncbi:gene transfer agent family protein [Pseudotabrizicola alkalilacus]|uniref:Gene transfer agent family protein n=1 Tax=Pseudotabrizicola alkalilacus TaxID=2305252 RepID=A0A411Z3Q8_9RHOB|nr:gene transfer agent family protein [Pseudotabrizicola alkalilacus]RGP37703.1 gene transfer agent family protein [Pseudotabrizicola alkalilacus]